MNVLHILLVLDRALLGLAQRISDWTQSRVGLTCFHLVHVCALCFAAVSVWIMVLMNLPALVIVDSVFLLILYTEWWQGKKSVKFGRQVVTKNILARGVRKSLWRINFCGIWFMWFLAAIAATYHRSELPLCLPAVHVGKAAFYMAGCYFAACTPRPPGKSRLRLAFERLQERLHALLPSTDPIPEPA
ncbi:MAG: hypothetical protein RL150_517 [Candidatus Parcubacteria bacterium]|jgi:hypothetical protein